MIKKLTLGTAIALVVGAIFIIAGIPTFASGGFILVVIGILTLLDTLAIAAPGMKRLQSFAERNG